MSYRDFTLKEMASLLVEAGAPDGVSKIMRRIRHWTNEDVLKTIGQKHTGTGISRRYSHHELEKTAVLIEAARYGLSINLLWNFSEWMDNLAEGTNFEEARNNIRSIYLTNARTSPFHGIRFRYIHQ